MTTQTVQQANLEVAVKPRQTAKTETASPKEGDSFRSSMERAEQSAARAAKNSNDRGDAQAAQQPDAMRSGEEFAPGESQPQRFGAEAEAMDGILSLMNQQTEQKPDTEELPAGTEEQMSLLAALTVQQPQQTELPQDMPAEDAQGVETLLAPQQEQTAALRRMAAPQEDGDAAAREGQTATQQQTIETIGSGTAGAASAVQADAEQAQAPAEQLIDNTSEAPAQEAAGAKEIQYPAASYVKPGFDALMELFTAEGEPLPGTEAGPALRESIFEQVQTAASTGKEDIYIQLKPESLGGLAIHLTMTEEGVKAQLRTGSQNIQSLINAEITQLEEALRARDIPIVQMEVLYEQPTANNFLDQRRGAWQGGGSGGQFGRNLGGVAQIDEPGSLYETALGAMPDAETEGEGRVYSA